MTYTLVTHVLLGGYKLLILNNIKTTLLLSGSSNIDYGFIRSGEGSVLKWLAARLRYGGFDMYQLLCHQHVYS